MEKADSTSEIILPLCRVWNAIRISLTLASVLVLGSYTLATAKTGFARERSSQQETTATPTGTAVPGSMQMIFKDRKLSAQIISAPLSQVMEELYRLSGAKVVWHGQEMNGLVSVAFTALSLDKAVRRILRDESYAFTYNASAEGDTLDKIIILPRARREKGPLFRAQRMPRVKTFAMPKNQRWGIGEGSNMELTDNETPLQESMDQEENPKPSDDEPGSQMQAIEALLLGDKGRAAEELIQVLASDPAPALRIIAAKFLSGLDSVPLDAVIDIAHDGPVPILRIKAAQYLAMHEDKDPRIEAALSDLAQEDHDRQNEAWNELKEFPPMPFSKAQIQGNPLLRN